MEKDLWHDIIDENIKIDLEKLPKGVRDMVEELEELHKKKDWFLYDLKFDQFESYCKSFIINGKLSEYTYKKLLEKYGGLYD